MFNREQIRKNNFVRSKTKKDSSPRPPQPGNLGSPLLKDFQILVFYLAFYSYAQLVIQLPLNELLDS